MTGRQSSSDSVSVSATRSIPAFAAGGGDGLGEDGLRGGCGGGEGGAGGEGSAYPHAASFMRLMDACVDEGHSRSKNSWQGVSAHSAPLHVSKLSTSMFDAALHECQHMSTQYGMKEPVTPAVLGLDMDVMNSVHSRERSLSTSPARQMASVRGLISRLTNSRMLDTTAIGGGGGAGGGSTETPPPGGGGGAALPDSQTTPSESLAEHGSIRAYM